MPASESVRAVTHDVLLPSVAFCELFLALLSGYFDLGRSQDTKQNKEAVVLETGRQFRVCTPAEQLCTKAVTKD